MLCHLLIEHVQTTMRNELVERKLPLTPGFHSINIAKYFKIIIIIQNTGRERAGVWSCKNAITEGLKAGTMNTFIQAAQSLNFGVIVSNPNSFQEEKFHSKRTMNVNNHIQTVFEFASSQPRCTSVHILGYGSGGSLALHLLKDKSNKKMKSIAFVDSHHTITDVELTPTKINWLKHNSKHWIASNEPLGTILPDNINSGFNCISGGSETIGGSLFSAMDSMLAFFEEKSDSI
uniref:Arb2 domain-containing protein n=1 Tax=Arcella intermedia TaxID=1963864 RepID=A0A6B2LEI8_9EUKA